MTREQFELIVELALAVHEMAPPDRQRRIAKAFEAMEAADRKAEWEEMEPPK